MLEYLLKKKKVKKIHYYYTCDIRTEGFTQLDCHPSVCSEATAPQPQLVVYHRP